LITFRRPFTWEAEVFITALLGAAVAGVGVGDWVGDGDGDIHGTATVVILIAPVTTRITDPTTTIMDTGIMDIPAGIITMVVDCM